MVNNLWNAFDTCNSPSGLIQLSLLPSVCCRGLPGVGKSTLWWSDCHHPLGLERHPSTPGSYPITTSWPPEGPYTPLNGWWCSGSPSWRYEPGDSPLGGWWWSEPQAGGDQELHRALLASNRPFANPYQGRGRGKPLHLAVIQRTSQYLIIQIMLVVWAGKQTGSRANSTVELKQFFA